MTTTKARKQRKAHFNAPWHKRRRMMSAHLSEEYLEDKKRKLPRAVPVRKGDVVKIMRGDDAGKEGKVATLDYRALRITIEGITHAKSDGKQVAKTIHPSNVRIVKLDETDPLRLKRFEGARR
jgi:large subunit ribosomal protein L24